MRYNQLLPLGESKKTSWPEIIALLSALGTSIYASSIQQSWFVIVPILLAVIKTILLLRDIGIFNWLVRSYRTRRAQVVGNLVVGKKYIEYLRFVERAEIVKELMHELRNAQWHNQKTIAYIQNINSTSFENLYNEILSSTKQQKLKRIREMKLLGQRFRDYFTVFDLCCLRLYSWGLREGEVKYQNEEHKKRIVQLKNKYDKFIEEYNNFCRTLTYKAEHEILTPIYDNPPDLDWSAGLKQDS